MVNSMFSSAMWRVQEVLHGKNTAALPGSLLAVASVLLVYRHMTEENHESGALKTFLALLLIQMLPLAFLEMKILGCADPVGLLCKFGSPVLLMHVCLLSLRVGGYYLQEVGYHWLNVINLVLAIAALHLGFDCKLSFQMVLQHYNVWCLTVVAMVAAYSQEYISELAKPGFHSGLLSDILVQSIHTGSDYIEILAFVPAVWMIHKEDKNTPRVTVESSETKRKAVTFFAFLLFFYSSEDVWHAFRLIKRIPLASLAHLLHFLLLLDFAVYVLAHFLNPQKLLSIKSWFSDTFCNGV